jgi:carboxylate-amine ligase
VQHIDAMLAAAEDGGHASQIHAELMQSVVEGTTPVCRTPAEIGTHLRTLRGHVAEIARSEGCRFGSAGTHPFSLFERQRITASDRYRRLVEQMQYIARRELIFGMHVHASVDGPDKAIAVANGLGVHIAELLALSASSPFWRGEPTGLQSSRQMVFSAFPRSGVPPRFGSYEEISEMVGQLERTGCIADYTHIWWDVRVHARLGTVELRICDAVTSVDDVVAITAYFQALVKRYSEEFDAGREVSGHHRILTVENKFLAARHGLEAPLMDLATGAEARVPLSRLVRRTLAELEPHARDLGSERELEGIEEILSRGNGADQQLRIWNANKDIVEVVREIAKTTEIGIRAAGAGRPA